MLKQLGRQDLLILDELGYVPFTKAGAELLFEVVSRAYEAAEPDHHDQSAVRAMAEVCGSASDRGHAGPADASGAYRRSQRRELSAQAIKGPASQAAAAHRRADHRSRYRRNLADVGDRAQLAWFYSAQWREIFPPLTHDPDSPQECGETSTQLCLSFEGLGISPESGTSVAATWNAEWEGCTTLISPKATSYLASKSLGYRRDRSRCRHGGRFRRCLAGKMGEHRPVFSHVRQRVSKRLLCQDCIGAC